MKHPRWTGYAFEPDGLDQYAPALGGWYRHITLAMLAQAYLVVTRPAAAERDKGDSKSGSREIRQRVRRAVAGLSPTDRTRGAPADRGMGLAAATRRKGDVALVGVAPPASRARQTRPLPAAQTAHD